MKTKLLATLIGACFAAPVLAQSNITIYGIADAGVQVTHNGCNCTKLVSGIADGSRLGFKGMEDLGNGYKAIFTLESRIELDTGRQQTGNISDNQGFALTKGLDLLLPSALVTKVKAATQPAVNVNIPNAIFDRTSMVGLVTPVGAIMAGRMYTPGYEVFAGADTFETGTAGTWGGITSGAGGILTAGIAIRSDKSLQYRMQLPNGVSGAVMYGFEKSGYIGLDKRFYSANLKYNANGFDVGVGYNNGQDETGQSGLISTVIGGSYAAGPMKIFAGYMKQRNEHSVLIPVVEQGFASTFDNLGATGVVLKGRLHSNLVQNFRLNADGYSLGIHYSLGAGRVMGSVSRQNDKTAFNNDATQYAIGYDYNLSKRTDLYSVLAYIKNQNGAQYSPGAASAPGGFTLTEGESSKALQLGMRYRF